MAYSNNGQWVYTLGFDKCGIVTPNAPGTAENSGGASKFSIDRS